MKIKKYFALLACSVAFLSSSNLEATQMPSQDELKSVPGSVYKTHPEYHPNGMH